MSDHRETQASDEPHGIRPGEWRGASGLCMCVECVRRREASARAQAASGGLAADERELLDDEGFGWALKHIDAITAENATLKEQLADKERECGELEAFAFAVLDAAGKSSTEESFGENMTAIAMPKMPDSVSLKYLNIAPAAEGADSE
jgi:hypothetical protein